MGTNYVLGNNENYTIGGLRLFFNEIISTVEQGYIYLGNVVTGGFTPEQTYLDHFTTRSGTRSKDRSVLQEQSVSMNFTLDEPNVDGMNLFMLGGDKTAVLSVSTPVIGYPAVANGTDWIYIPHKSPTAIVVKDLAGAVTFILNTDYTIETFLGYSRIKRIVAGAILNAQILRVNYTYTKLASTKFSPFARTSRVGKALIQGVSDSGNEFEWEVDSCSLKPDGEFSYNDQDWSQFSFVMEILDNSGAAPTEPFGRMFHLGTGTNL